MIEQNLWEDIFLNIGIPEVGACLWDELPSLLPCRGIARVPKDAQSVIVAIFPYYVGEYPQRNVARYTLGRDYHHIVGGILKECTENLRQRFPNYSFEEFVDSSPIPEVAAGVLAGLGVVGRNFQLLHPRYGSYFFIGCVVTNMELCPRKKEGNVLCSGCNACISACPTGALTLDGFDKSRCLSFLTQKKGELTKQEQEEIQRGGMVWGCDVCTDCCPHNAFPVKTPLQQMYEQIVPVVEESNLEKCIDCKALGYRGIAVIRRNMELLKGDYLR